MRLRNTLHWLGTFAATLRSSVETEIAGEVASDDESLFDLILMKNSNSSKSKKDSRNTFLSIL
ncbi:hypothetical protein KDW_01220 [Dictyobacter vulcani]|uniref:Uncharacterized protein n=1 Tax=Dictyobacter vulcani TaxID=2607529 RepID=A0A5J4KIA1_9CHLR|nr:hypothetical protein KDW_01220 [Dictyobacter vulcani]